MDLHLHYVEPATPTLPFQSFSKAEDSGYHTFTPSALESELSNDLLDTSRILNKTSVKSHIQSNRKPTRPKTQLEVLAETPPVKRGVKRLYQDTDIYNSVPTPTTAIASKIKSLDVNENKENSSCFISPLSGGEKYNRELSVSGYELAYPSTPVKNNCVLNPCRKTPKKLSFIHSLSCEASELQPVIKQKSMSATKCMYTPYRPEHKIDILSCLYQVNCAVAISKVFDYLSNEDIQHVTLVCSTWRDIWEYQPKKKKRDYYQYLKNAKENQENKERGIVGKVKMAKQTKLLSEIHNEIHNNLTNHGIQRSPPSTPKTNRFRKYAKTALLDHRSQMVCARCQQPAKVTKEASGEVWAECTSLSCSYQFCKNCKCNRHPETTCFQYDLDGPSPSKRRKNPYAVGTRKSKKNLRRLMDNS